MQGNLSLVETPWILWSIVMLIISAFVFMTKVVPLQKPDFELASSEEKFFVDLVFIFIEKVECLGNHCNGYALYCRSVNGSETNVRKEAQSLK